MTIILKLELFSQIFSNLGRLCVSIRQQEIKIMLIITEKSPISKQILKNLLDKMIRNNSAKEQFKNVFENLECQVKFDVKI